MARPTEGCEQVLREHPAAVSSLDTGEEPARAPGRSGCTWRHCREIPVEPDVAAFVRPIQPLMEAAAPN